MRLLPAAVAAMLLTGYASASPQRVEVNRSAKYDFYSAHFFEPVHDCLLQNVTKKGYQLEWRRGEVTNGINRYELRQAGKFVGYLELDTASGGLTASTHTKKDARLIQDLNTAIELCQKSMNELPGR